MAGLLANIGLPQQRDDGVELRLITSGDDLMQMSTFLRGRDSFQSVM